MATVYLALDLRHGRKVAIKVLRPELAAVLGPERFLNEIRITAGLDHPHILTLLDSGQSNGFLWYVLPFVRGESLADKLHRDQQLGLDDALSITRQVASALDFAHQRGVIHRDVKPQNILLHEGEAVLADFGIALAVREAGGNRLTETGLSLGTPEYMSPEQATGNRQLDARSDVYSLAAVLYEMLAGEPPHTGPTAHAVYRQADDRAAHPAPRGARHGPRCGGPSRRKGLGQDSRRPVHLRRRVCESPDGLRSHGAPSATPPSVLPGLGGRNRCTSSDRVGSPSPPRFTRHPTNPGTAHLQRQRPNAGALLGRQASGLHY
jgi:serine/threonine protein kinase